MKRRFIERSVMFSLCLFYVSSVEAFAYVPLHLGIHIKDWKSDRPELQKTNEKSLTHSWFAEENQIQKDKDSDRTTDRQCGSVCREFVAKTLFGSAHDFSSLGQYNLAIQYLRKIIDIYPETKEAEKAKIVLKEWTKKSRFDSGGRAEFVVVSSLYGLGLGMFLPISFATADASPALFGLSIVGFTALGLTGSLLASQRWPITKGQAASVTSGILWGVGNSLIINALFESEYQNGLQFSLLGSVLGYGGGLALGYLFRPSVGQITLASSLAGWLPGFSLLTMGILASEKLFNFSFKAFLTTVLVTANSGFLGGLFLAPYLRFSRERMILMNTGGVLGGALGPALLLIVQTENPTFYLAAGLVGSIAGLFLTGYLTRSMRPESKQSNGPVGGALFQIEGKKWAFTMPSVSILPYRHSTGEMDVQLFIPLASGRW